MKNKPLKDCNNHYDPFYIMIVKLAVAFLVVIILPPIRMADNWLIKRRYPRWFQHVLTVYYFVTEVISWTLKALKKKCQRPKGNCLR
jgi:hypothetical protein